MNFKKTSYEISPSRNAENNACYKHQRIMPLSDGSAVTVTGLIRDSALAAAKLVCNNNLRNSVSLFSDGENFLFDISIDGVPEMESDSLYDIKHIAVKYDDKNAVFVQYDHKERSANNLCKDRYLPTLAYGIARCIQTIADDQKTAQLAWECMNSQSGKDEYLLRFIKHIDQICDSWEYTARYQAFDVKNASEYSDNVFVRALKRIDSITGFSDEKQKIEYAEITNIFSPDAYNVKSYLPPDDCEFDSRYNPLCNALGSGDVITALFYGPAGTGKSVLAKQVCQKINLPVRAVVNCNANSDESVLGKYVPKGEHFVFVENGVADAIREGGAVVFEEINYAKPQNLSFLNSLLDDNSFVMLDNGERIERHPNFRFFATMNIGYAGTNKMNPALFNRIDIKCEVEELSDETIRNALNKVLIPEYKKYVDNMINAYHKIKEYFYMEDSDKVISIRNLKSWAHMIKHHGGDVLSAAEGTIVSIAADDEDTKQAIRDVLRLYIWA